MKRFYQVLYLASLGFIIFTVVAPSAIAQGPEIVIGYDEFYAKETVNGQTITHYAHRNGYSRLVNTEWSPGVGVWDVNKSDPITDLQGSDPGYIIFNIHVNPETFDQNSYSGTLEAGEVTIDSVRRGSDNSLITGHDVTVKTIHLDSFLPQFTIRIEVPSRHFSDIPFTIKMVISENAVQTLNGVGNPEIEFSINVVPDIPSIAIQPKPAIVTPKYDRTVRDGSILSERGSIKLADLQRERLVDTKNDPYGYIVFRLELNELIFVSGSNQFEASEVVIADVKRSSDGSSIPNHGVKIYGMGSYGLLIVLRVPRSLFDDLPITIDMKVSKNAVRATNGLGNAESSFSINVINVGTEFSAGAGSPDTEPLPQSLGPPAGIDAKLTPTIAYSETALDGTVIVEEGLVKLANKLNRGLADLATAPHGYISYEINFGATIWAGDMLDTSEVSIVEVKSTVDDSSVADHGIVVEKITHSVNRLGYFVVDIKVPRSLFDKLPLTVLVNIKKHAVRTAANRGNAAAAHTHKVVKIFPSEVLEQGKPKAVWTYYDLTLNGSLAGSQGLVKLTDASGNRLVDLENDAHGYLTYEVAFSPDIHAEETLDISEISIVSVKSPDDDSSVETHGIVIERITQPRFEDYFVVDIKVPSSLFDKLPLTIDAKINENAVRTSDGTFSIASPHTINLVATFPPPKVVIFTELMFETEVSGTAVPQWIEVYNNSDAAVNLRGWKLQTKHLMPSLLQTTTFQKDFIIPVNRSRLLVTGLGQNSGETALLEESVYQLDLSPVIVRGGFSLKLLNADDMLIDDIGTLEADEHTWVLPDCIIEGDRSSLLRRFENKVPRAGTAATGWSRAVDTEGIPQRIYYGHAEDIGTPGYQHDLHAPVQLSHFSARFIEGAAVIRWITESELDNAGFNILRSTSRTGEFRPVNTQLIQGAGTTGQRTEYTWTDTTAKPNVVYYYRIEDVDFSGERRLLKTQQLRGTVSPTHKLLTTWGTLKGE